MLQQVETGKHADRGWIALVDRERLAGDADWALAMQHAETLLRLKWGGQRLRQVIADARQAKLDLDRMRQAAADARRSVAPQP